MAATYIRNRCYIPRTREKVLQTFTGIKPNIDDMYIFEIIHLVNIYLTLLRKQGVT